MPTVQKNTGFTLLEVMLAMTLLSIMVVLLFSSLKIGAESWNRGESKIAEVNEKAVVYQFFKRHLPSIRPLWDDFSDDERSSFSFQGEPDTFQFVSFFPVSAARKGLQLFKVGPDKSEKGVVKVILMPFYPTIEDQQWDPEEVVLLENVEEFELSYFGKVDSDSEAAWVDSWQEKKYLPALLKIKIVLKDRSYWPEMIFALKLSAMENNSNQTNTSNLAPVSSPGQKL